MVYFLLCWVFVGYADFSLVVASGSLLVCATVFSCGGFSVVKHGLCGHTGSVAVACGLSSCSSWTLSTGSLVVVHGLSCMQIFLDQGWQASCLGRQILQSLELTRVAPKIFILSVCQYFWVAIEFCVLLKTLFLLLAA